ncbi:MAG: MMPL family transporter [Pseudomonadales bacterium]|nr:MMPL family transporter [Pseudomonadales bacterium]MBO7006593.1 MMPL family transporter [Pseudomonadales bacterium]
MLEALLANWTAWVVKHARAVLTIVLLATMGAAWVAVTQFQMNSDTSRLIRQDTDWKRTHDTFLDTFPQYYRNTFVVVSGNQPNKVSQVARELASDIRAHTEVFKSVYSPASNDFVDANALLYLHPETLNDTVSKLADAQPFLTAIAKDNSLRSALQLAIDALESDEPLPAGFIQMSDALSMAAERAIDGNDKPISWRDELFQADADASYYQVIFVQGAQNFGEDMPDGLIINTLESVIDELAHPYIEDVTVRLTGQVPLEHGEILSAMNSAQFAGTLAMAILVGVLIWGVRSLRIIAATYLSMLVGLIWTAAFAMLTVGAYNTISIIFLVMFIGLGVDFAVHLCLKYQEARTELCKTEALIGTGHELGPAIALCGVTSAIGFLAFVPTDYIGLAEMGIISGGGMIIAVMISLTLIPAFFAVVSDPRPPTDLPFVGAMTNIVADHSKTTAYVTLTLAVILTAIASQASFDYSTLSLKDPESEAMTTLQELQDEDVITDYALTYMAPDLDAADNAKERLNGLAEVSEVRVPGDYLPEHQDENLYILEDASFFLESVFDPVEMNEAFSDAALLKLLVELQTGVETALASSTAAELSQSLASLNAAIAVLIESNAETRAKFTDLIVPPIRKEIDWLGTALFPDELALRDLPEDTRSRLISPDGHAIVSITPAEDVLPVAVMRRFTKAVREEVPEVTGRPILDIGIGEIVVKAFATAIGLAVIGIFAVLMLTLRSFVDSILVFIPLAMTAMLTLAVSVLIGLPLNMANVVVIPLIFGLGVDNGIHIVKRFHQCADVNDLVHCSTPKAVFLSNLTTLGTFCALSFSTHQGIYSIGVLLTVALTALMFLTIIALPALLATFSSPKVLTQESVVHTT